MAESAAPLSASELADAGYVMAAGALAAIHALLDDGGIPRGTFADDHVRNLVALYNQRGAELDRLRAALDHIRLECEATHTGQERAYTALSRIDGIARRALV